MATRAGSNTVGDLEEAKLLQAEDQFVFLQNTTKKAKRISRKNFFNTPGLIVKGKILDPEGNDVGFSAATALANAATAQATAEGAQTSANGKNRIFYQNTAPTNPIGSPAYYLIENDLWYETDNGYKMSKWNGSTWVPYELGNAALESIDVGKLTAGFITSQVIEVANSTAYIQSNNFILTWVSGMVCKTYNNSAPLKGKASPSDNVRCKVLQTDGSYKVFNCLQDHTSSAGNAPPASGSNTWWQEISTPTIPVTIVQGESAVNIDDMGFRIVGNGQAEFSGVLTRGAVIAKEGFFGTTKNAARIDTNGLTIGNYGRIKSAGIGYSGTDFTSSVASGGFFLGNTQSEGEAELYQFFIGKPSGNYMRWNGANLSVNGQLVAATSDGLDSEAGLVINSGFGIRYGDKTSVLTITGGDGNGITNGAQIDLVGTQYNDGGPGNGSSEGQLILSAGYDSTLSTNSADGCIIFRTSRESANANIGVQRLRVDLDGTVRVINAGNAYAGAPDSGAGKFVVPNVITVGGSSSTTIFGNHNGYIYIKRNDNKTRISMDGFLGNMYFFDGTNDNDVSITLNGEEGTIEAAQYTSTSSKRFKKKIRNFKNGLETISKLRPVIFDWKNKEIKNDIGLIAEEVNEVIPNLVGLNNKGEVVGIDYGKLTPILIQAVKELSLEVERLKNKIK